MFGSCTVSSIGHYASGMVRVNGDITPANTDACDTVSDSVPEVDAMLEPKMANLTSAVLTQAACFRGIVLKTSCSESRN